MNVTGTRTGISRLPQKIHFFRRGFIAGAYRAEVGITRNVMVQGLGLKAIARELKMPPSSVHKALNLVA